MADADELTLHEGDKIDVYVVEKVLGSGSFGVTYVAFDETLGRRVAIKEYMPVQYARRDASGTINSRNAESQGTFEWGLNRFSDEARTLAQFDHPNIVRVLRILQDVNGTSYIVMELLSGTNFETLIEDNGPLDTPRFLSVFRQIVEGMQAVHALGILHRDIKPANMVLEDRGPVLIDFGAARDLAMQQKTGFSALVTDGYSPPEQYSSKNMQGEASDIYALAATAHFLLSGQVPPPAAARSAGEEIPPALEVRADLPEDVASAIDHALAMKMADRPASITEWLAEMPSLTTEEKETEVVVIEKRVLGLDRRGLLIAGGGLAVAATAGVMLWQSDRSISGSAEGKGFKWRKPVSSLSSEPYPGINVGSGGVYVAGHDVSDTGDRFLAVRFDTAGNETARFTHPDPGTRAHAILPLEDGGAIVGGAYRQAALVLALDADFKVKWTQTLEPGSISTLMRLGGRVVAGLEGPETSGKAKLLVLTPETGKLESDIVLLDRQGDSVQQIAPLADGNIAVLGTRKEERLVDGKNALVTNIWVSKVAPDGEELWRTTESGLGYSIGLDIIEAGGAIFASGKTSAEPEDASYRMMVMRLDNAGQKVWTRHDYAEAPSTARGFAKSASGRPALYLVGWAGNPPRAQVNQINPDGDMIWQYDSEDPPQMGDDAAVAAIGEDGALYALGARIEDTEVNLTLSAFE